MSRDPNYDCGLKKREGVEKMVVMGKWMSGGRRCKVGKKVGNGVREC